MTETQLAAALAREAALRTDLDESRKYALALVAEMRDRTIKTDRDRKLVEAQVDRLLAMTNSMDDDFQSLRSATEALGAMPEGYCFCSKDRIGDDSKIHEPECAELREALAVKP